MLWCAPRFCLTLSALFVLPMLAPCTLAPCTLAPCTLAPCTLAPRALKPHPSVFRMANEARWIVEGAVGEGGVVTVTRQWFAADGVDEVGVGGRITVPALVGLSRTPDAFGESLPSLQPDSVLLFLGEQSESGVWAPLYLLDGGARGVLWFAGSGTWGFGQQVNPGPYSLLRWHVCVGERSVPATPDQVRQQLDAGLGARAKWSATLAIVDDDERAKALAAWLGTRSPDGEFWLERLWPDVGEALRALGDHAVDPLAEVVATEPEGYAVAFAARLLGDRGAAASAAVPRLIARLRDLRDAQPLALVEALTRIADPRAIEVLRELLAGSDELVAAEAARALHAVGDREVVERLVRRIPSRVTDTRTPRHLAALLEALHELDAATAERLARERFLQHPEVLQEREWMRRL